MLIMTTHRVSLTRVALGAASLALVGACATPPAMAGSAAAEPAAQVVWGACPEDVVAKAAPSRLDCATVPVPVDYADPASGEIDIMISRLASQDPSKRRGVLLLNPGGPGGSGLTLAALLVAQGLPASVTDSYDVIGMDTRGIGYSAPVTCGFTVDGPYFANIPPYAVDAAAVVERAAVAEGAAQQCAQNDRDGLLRHLTTANMARDLDRIRAALGEEKASFLGYSYGSALGAAYASLFPERSDRIVLDSNVGDTHLDRDGMRRYALGMEQTFPAFASWVAERHDSYGLGRTADEVRATYAEIAARLDDEPVQGIDGATFRAATFGGLFNERQYASTAQLWQSMRTGAPLPPAPGGPPDLVALENSLSVFLSVTCNDVDWPEDVQTYQRAVAQDRERFPLYGAAAANITPCAYWPYEPAEAPVEIADEGPTDVLLVQNRYDPPTPYRGGELLREKFGSRARLVSVDASGHGAYVLGGNACASDVTTRYLVDGEMPEDDVTCRAS
ncbi:alpha/beta hydrolase [Pseudonocardia xinjiangensis]